ncbi:hypothetical protein lerEdw1_007071 [Lerista edwardsae]|nr:hypothetical protein lerEdw1_007071 [Lerista edwardsae]
MTGLEEDPEFDFDFLFEFNQSDEGAGSSKEHYNYPPSNINSSLPLGVAHPSLSTPCHGLQTSNPVISIIPSTIHPSGYGGHPDSGTAGYYLPPNIRPNGVPALESPRIEITSYLGLHNNNNQFFHDDVEEAMPNAKRSPSTATLNLPNIEAYRDPSCLSPASSLSSRSCNSEASSYESNYSYPYTSPQTSPWQSPCVSPKTTDTEEGYQRSMSSPRVSVTDETWLGNTNQYTSSAIVAAINALTTDSTIDMNDGIPIKSRKTAIDHTPSMTLKTEPSGDDHGTISPTTDLSPEDFSGFQHIRKGNFCDQYLSVPQHPYQWAKSKPLSPTSYMSPSLPALDWQLPSHSGPYELQIEVQPKSHHRAHYETEGSRGAVKASAGGHPVVQVTDVLVAAMLVCVSSPPYVYAEYVEGDTVTLA